MHLRIRRRRESTRHLPDQPGFFPYAPAIPASGRRDGTPRQRRTIVRRSSRERQKPVGCVAVPYSEQARQLLFGARRIHRRQDLVHVIRVFHAIAAVRLLQPIDGETNQLDAKIVVDGGRTAGETRQNNRGPLVRRARRLFPHRASHPARLSRRGSVEHEFERLRACVRFLDRLRRFERQRAVADRNPYERFDEHQAECSLHRARPAHRAAIRMDHADRRQKYPPGQQQRDHCVRDHVSGIEPSLRQRPPGGDGFQRGPSRLGRADLVQKRQHSQDDLHALLRAGTVSSGGERLADDLLLRRELCRRLLRTGQDGVWSAIAAEAMSATMPRRRGWLMTRFLTVQGKTTVAAHIVTSNGAPP